MNLRTIKTALAALTILSSAAIGALSATAQTAPVATIQPASEWAYQENTGRWEFSITVSEPVTIAPASTFSQAKLFNSLDLDITGATVFSFENAAGSISNGVRRIVVSLSNVTGPITVAVAANKFLGDDTNLPNTASTPVTFDVPTGTPTASLTEFAPQLDADGAVVSLTTQMTVDQPFFFRSYLGREWNLTNGNLSLGTIESGSPGKPVLNPAGTYTLQVDPTANGTVSFNTGAAIFNARGWQTGTAPASNTITYDFTDTSRPTLELSPLTRNGAFYQTNVTASEALADLTADDLELVNATLFRVSGAGTAWRILISPMTNTDAQISVRVLAEAVADLRGNTNAAASNAVTLDWDDVPPTATLGEFTDIGGVLNAVLTANEEIAGVAESDFTVTGGSVQQVLETTGDRTIFNIRVQPSGPGTVTLQLKANSVRDITTPNTNNTAASNQISFDYTDTIAPVVTLTDFSLINSGTQLRTTVRILNGPGGIAFDPVSDFTADDLVLTGASVASFPTGTRGEFRIDVTPVGGPVSMSVKAGSVTDQAGNVNADVSRTINYNFVDTTPPTITLGALADQGNGTYTSAVTISESVTDFELADLSLTNAAATLTGSGTAYTITLTPQAPGSFGVSVGAGTFTDSSANANTASNTVQAVFVDSFPPTITLGDLTATAPGVFTSAITINEPTTDFDAADLTVTLGTATLTGSGTSYTATVTANADGTVKLSVAAGTFTDASGNNNLVSNEVAVAYDSTPPTVTIGALAGPAAGKYTAAIVLSEPVASFTAANLTLTNATATLTGSGTTYSAVLTPVADGTVKLSVAANAIADASGNRNAASNEVQAIFDGTPPSVSISDLVRDGGIYRASVTLSEVVTGFAVDDLTLTNATATLSGAGLTRQVVLTPIADGLVELSVLANRFQDGAGNQNSASNKVSGTFVAIPPEASLATPVGPVAGTYTIAITLNVASTNFAAADLAVTNGTATMTGSGTSYTATITPTADGVVKVSVPAGRFTDAAGTANLVSNEVTFTFDGTAPTVSIAALAGPGSGPYTTTITISEPTSDFALADLSLTNATATLTPTNATDIGGGVMAATLFSAVLTPQGDGEVKLSVDAGKLTDAAGNGNIASNEVSIQHDATPPSVTVGAFVGPANGQRTVVLTTSEAAVGFEASDLTLSNLTIVSLVDQGGGTSFLATVNPVGDGAMSLSVGAGVFTDAAGNANTASNTATGTHDGTAPTLAITTSVASFSGTAPFAATFTFSERVTGFDLADIAVTNGAASDLAGGANVYTATITPTGGGDVGLVVAAGSVDDLAGNALGAEATATISDNTVEQTVDMITDYIGSRGTNLIANQTRLTNFMLGGTGSGAFNAQATQGFGNFNLDMPIGNTNTWLRLKGAWSEIGPETSSYVLGSFGHHVFLNENLLVGGMLQFDYAEAKTGTAETEGFGWLAGPYMVARLPDQPLYFELAALAGRSYNTASPLGTFTDDFLTTRTLVTSRVTGEILLPTITWRPSLSLAQTTDTAQSYRDSLGNTIPEQRLSILELSMGMAFEKPLDIGRGDFSLNGGLTSTFSSTEGLSAAQKGIVENTRARIDLGFDYVSANNLRTHFSAYHDGLLADGFKSTGFELRFDFTF